MQSLQCQMPIYIFSLICQAIQKFQIQIRLQDVKTPLVSPKTVDESILLFCLRDPMSLKVIQLECAIGVFLKT